MPEPLVSQMQAASLQPGGPDRPLPDMLAYMADMILELGQMADPTPCRTLAGLLRLAHAEALLRRDEALRTGQQPR